MAEQHVEVLEGNADELNALICKYKTALLTTIGGDGRMHTRPMALQKSCDVRHELLFVTSDHSQKVLDVEAGGACGLTFHGGAFDSDYASISGHAEIVRDRATIHALWEPDWKVWFPDGPDSPEIALVRFIPEHAEYVVTRGGRVKVLAQEARALLTRKPAKPADKREVDLVAH